MSFFWQQNEHKFVYSVDSIVLLNDLEGKNKKTEQF